jgi:hypothetical protein
MLYSLYPFFVAIWLRLDHQPASRLTAIRIIIACMSAILLTWAGAGTIDLTGVAFMLIAAALYAVHIPINQRVLFDAWPNSCVQVAVHKELTEAQKRQRNVPANPPTLLLMENWFEARKVCVGRVLVFDSRNLNGEVPPHLLYKR